ncbi:MAG: hypothetical protein HY763_14055 [Planctomycetes bacterium]|nr:hypothetical protein [Planctomycetota bacterium]
MSPAPLGEAATPGSSATLPVAGRPRLFRTAAAAFALLMALGALELLAVTGLVDYRIVLRTPFAKAWENPRNRLDPELLHLHRPYDSYSGLVPGDLTHWYGIETDRRYPVDVRYDGNGFRNAVDLETADVVVVGDSFVEGGMVLDPHLVTTRLAESLGTTVLNLGQIGYGPQQEAAVVRRYGLPAQPKVVVWVVFEGNDLTHDFLRYERCAREYAAYVRGEHGFGRRSFTRNAALLAGRLLFGARRSPQLGLRRSGVLNVPGAVRGQRMYFGYDVSPFSEAELAAIDAALGVVAGAARQCADRGAAFLVVFAPIEFRVYRDLCTFDPQSEPARWAPSDLPERVARWAQGVGVAYLDLTPALREAAARGELVYFLDDGHWTAEGHAVAASAIAQAVADRGWLGRP